MRYSPPIETDLTYYLTTYGGAALLVVSFLAATLLPFSSEAGVVAALALDMPAGEVVLWASIGNCLGVTLNYFLGRWGSERLIRGLESKSGRRALAWSDRYGKWGLLLSWLPIVGDPLTIVAGVMRVPFPFFAVVAYGVRIIRYLLLALAFAPA